MRTLDRCGRAGMVALLGIVVGVGMMSEVSWAGSVTGSCSVAGLREDTRAAGERDRAEVRDNATVRAGQELQWAPVDRGSIEQTARREYSSPMPTVTGGGLFCFWMLLAWRVGKGKDAQIDEG